ncbi:hypothetical protein PGB90_005855 [Kerria lacca]
MDEPLKKKFKIEENDIGHELEVLQEHLLRNCLCSLDENVIQKLFWRFNSGDVLWSDLTNNWSTEQILMLITCVQLICEKTMKQSATGFICSRIADVHNALTHKENNIIDYFIELADDSDMFVSFAASRALTSFFLAVKSRLDQRWLDKLTENIEDTSQPLKVSFSLDVLKRIIEWKDFDEHVLEDNISTENAILSNCHTLSIRSEHFDSTQVKCLCIKSLESKWVYIVNRFESLIKSNATVYESTIITFLNLWEAMISVKANLSIIDTKPFYSNLNRYVPLLSNNTSAIVWKHILNLFNEVLCYGSTLALQHDMANEPCSLAHLIVRTVKDRRLLHVVPYINGSGGFGGGNLEGDRVLLKKLVLLILKAIAVTVKEAKYDSSSDSSVGSEMDDEDADMAVISRSIRDVLKRVDNFIKQHVHFHPETSPAKWIVQLFTDQDDYLVESMICCLDVARVLCYRNNYLPDLRKDLNPSETFLQFLHTVSFDWDVLLDFLVSNETCFLLYILNFLKYVRDHWDEFLDTCDRKIDRVMISLAKLRESVEKLVSKDLFPYNINPILSLLIECHKKYGAYSGTLILR